MKNERQEKILQIIRENDVETQEGLLRHLKKMGVNSTQATISRDIKQLHLVKQPTGSGGYRYAVSASKPHLNVAEKLRTIFRESITQVDCAQNMVVIKTMPGMASAACAAVDAMDVPYMVGSLAGDDTVFLVMRKSESAEEFTEEIHSML
ncbi:MAG: arginine repressor [Oscillospiraceae bacterium]